MGWHDEGKRSHRFGHLRLWRASRLSRSRSVTQPTLDLITSRGKEQRLTGRWRGCARVPVCECVHTSSCVHKRKGEKQTLEVTCIAGAEQPPRVQDGGSFIPMLSCSTGSYAETFLTSTCPEESLSLIPFETYMIYLAIQNDLVERHLQTCQ